MPTDPYFSAENQMRYMSASQYKSFARCESAALAELKGTWSRPKTSALLIGGYVDSFLDGTTAEFLADHPEMVSTRGPTKGELKSEFKAAEAMVDRFRQDAFFLSHLDGDKQVVVQGDIGGVLWRGKIDILHADRIVDFKTVRDFEHIWSNGERLPFAEYWGYDLQMAIYQELARQVYGDRRPVYLACVTKQTPADLAILHIPDDVLQVRLAEAEYFGQRYADIKLGRIEPDRCERCDYCRATKRLTAVVDYRDI